MVNNIAQAREELISRGVHISGIIDVGGGVEYAWFTDPDGNSLTCTRWPGEPAAASEPPRQQSASETPEEGSSSDTSPTTAASQDDVLHDSIRRYGGGQNNDAREDIDSTAPRFLYLTGAVFVAVRSSHSFQRWPRIEMRRGPLRRGGIAGSASPRH